MREVLILSGKILLLAALVLHAFYIGYCLVRKSYQPRAKYTLYVCAFGLMLMFLLLGVIQWDFRWKPLLLGSGLAALYSLAALLRRRREKPFHAVKAAASVALSCLLTFALLLPALMFPPYTLPAPGGEYRVLTAERSYYDDTRIETYDASGHAREVNVGFWYPDTDTGRFPLILFDHGFCGIKDSNESTFIELASHGYVVCSIDHPYQSFYSTNSQGKTTLIDRGYLSEYAQTGDDLEENVRLLLKWLELRVADTNFVLDTVLAQEGGFYSLVDRDSIGIFGHSLGGATAAALGRVRGGIDAVVNLDGPMAYEITGLDAGAYTTRAQPYPAPILSIYSQYLYENGLEQKDPLYQVNRLASATAPAFYEVVLEGARHMNLTDLVLFSPFLASVLDSGRKADIDPYECLSSMNRVILKFFDSTLKDAGGFKAPGVSSMP